jgi:hypothetical protein
VFGFGVFDGASAVGADCNLPVGLPGAPHRTARLGSPQTSPLQAFFAGAGSGVRVTDCDAMLQGVFAGRSAARTRHINVARCVSPASAGVDPRAWSGGRDPVPGTTPGRPRPSWPYGPSRGTEAPAPRLSRLEPGYGIQPGYLCPGDAGAPTARRGASLPRQTPTGGPGFWVFGFSCPATLNPRPSTRDPVRNRQSCR